MVELVTTEIGRLRLVSMLEGISYLLLMGVAMPLKYLADDPSWVRVVGRIHGGLVIVFLLVLIQALVTTRLGIKRAIVGFVLSLLPFGAFVYEWMLRRDAAAIEPAG